MNVVLLENLGCSSKLLQENAAKLRAMGHELRQFEKTDDINALKNRVKDADVIMLANMPLPAEVLAAAPNVKFIDVAFTGVDHVPVNYAKSRGVAISNASGYANDAVAELCVSFMIQLLRDLGKAERRAREGGVKTGLKANLLKGKTVGLIGAGAIGKTLAALLKAFGAKVIVHNRRPLNDPNVDANVTLDELLTQADIVSLHCPLTPETKGMINKENLAKMKKDAFLVNAARGPVVDNAALADALNKGIIAGAACDVFDMEPPLPPDYPLLNCKNIIVTPHLGFYAEEAMENRANIVFDNLYSWLNGKQINPV